MRFFFSDFLGLPADRNRALPGLVMIFVAPVNEQQCGMELSHDRGFSGQEYGNVGQFNK